MTEPIHIPLNAYPTSVTAGDGKFHPAFRVPGYPVRYWPNIKFANEDDASEAARKSLADVQKAAWQIYHDWNVIEL